MNKNSTCHDIFREVFEKSSAALLLINAEGDIVMLNDSFCRMSGYTKEELIGIKWFSKMNSTEVKKLQEMNQRRLRKDPNVPNEHEISYLTKDGKLKYALLSPSLIEQTSQTICTFLDITKRKVVEEELRITKEYYQSIVEYAGDIIYSINLEGYFNYVSPVMLKKMGYTPEEVIGVDFSQYVYPDDVSLLQEHFDLVRINGQRVSGLEFRAIHKNGALRWFSVSASPLLDAEGRITAIVGVGNEITDRKSIEKALQRSEKLLWTLFNSIPDMIWLKDAEGVFMACNETFQKFVGKSSDEIVGKTDYDLVNKEDADAVMLMDNRVITDNKVHRYEEKLFFSGVSKEILLETIKIPVFSDRNELIGVLGIARDITKRKQMEEKLSESLTFFRESQNAGFIGSYKYYFDSKTWESSEVLDQIFGIGSDYKRDVTTWLGIIHPEDQQRIFPELTDNIAQKKDFNAEYRIVRYSDHTTRWVHGIGKLVCDEEGNQKFLIGTVQDITKRKLAEEAAFESQTKLSIALKLAHLGPWEYNVEEKRFYFNDTFYALYKTTSRHMGGIAMSIEEYTKRFIHPDEGDVVGREMQKALRSKKPIYINRLEHRILYANGEEGYVAVQIASIRDDNGKTIKIFGINQDITAAKYAEKELRNSAEELRELNAMKDKFFSIIAHDLRGPFSSIVGFSDLLVSQIKQNELDHIEQYATSILESSHLTMDLLTNLLEWSRSETGRMDFKPKEIDLIATINTSIELLRPIAEEKSINIKPISANKTMVVADASLLSTIFRNLISNALKFTHENGEVKVDLQKKATEWLIKVIDTGVGISKEKIEKLFRIDQNLSTLGTHKEKGTGLGLVLCKEFVEKHGGKIWVNSEENKGSEFCFTLPFTLQKMD